MTDELQQMKQCPFCLKEDSLAVISSTEVKDARAQSAHDPASWVVVCDATMPGGRGGCGASGGFRGTPKEAIQAWNMRGEK